MAQGDRAPAWKIRWQQRQNQPNSADRKGNARDRSTQRERQAFGHHLPDQPISRRAQGGAYRNLPLP